MFNDCVNIQLCYLKVFIFPEILGFWQGIPLFNARSVMYEETPLYTKYMDLVDSVTITIKGGLKRMERS